MLTLSYYIHMPREEFLNPDTKNKPEEQTRGGNAGKYDKYRGKSAYTRKNKILT